jgi:hypothetical protein
MCPGYFILTDEAVTEIVRCRDLNVVEERRGCADNDGDWSDKKDRRLFFISFSKVYR